MDANDPEKRVTGFENGTARPRFVVSVQPKAWQRYSAIGSLFVALLGFSRIYHANHGGLGSHFIMGLAFAVIWGLVIQWVFIGRKVVLCVTTDGLTISKRPGDVFPFRDAELGQWRKTGGRFGPYAGRALFLSSGTHRFVLGDLKNPSDANRVPIEGPQVLHQDLDAWTTKSATFDELLAVITSARGR